MNIDSIIKKLIIRYPFGDITTRLKFKENLDIDTAATDGNVVYYNPNFVSELTESQRVFLFGHEIMHVAFNHLLRKKDKNPHYWNVATDAVINAILKSEGWESIPGIVDMPEALQRSAEEVYEMIINDKYLQQKYSQEGHDSHNIWDDAIKREEGEKQEKQGNQQDKQQKTQEQKSEQEIFKENTAQRKQENKKYLEKLKSESRKIENNIESANLHISWQNVLLRMMRKVCHSDFVLNNQRKIITIGENGEEHKLWTYKLENFPKIEIEIVLDTSGSISDELLRSFLRECKQVIEKVRQSEAEYSVKVGCFDTEFYGFTKLRNTRDIEKMEFKGHGGTDFNVAVDAFSNKTTCKIIFTDGFSSIPRNDPKDIIWIVFGRDDFKPNGTVISISKEQRHELENSSASLLLEDR